MFERISDLDQRGLTRGNYYSNPIPGIGTSFHNLITDESQFLANKINQTELQTVEERIADFEIRMHSPGVTDLLGTLMYAVIIILLAAAQALAIVVIAFGFIATAVCVLVGPVFVPFFIVPKMEWLFWGWFRCFIQYAFYQVIAAAVVYVIANLILGIMDLSPKARSRRSNSLRRTTGEHGYTIGGMMVFPGNRIDGKQTINGARGFN